MEPKKNPKYDVHRMRGIIFNISLAISLLIVITAFRWTAPIKETKPPVDKYYEQTDIVYVPVTTIEKKVELKQQKIVTKVINPTEFIEVKNNTPIIETLAPPLDQEAPLLEPITVSDSLFSPENVDPVPVGLVEVAPEPVGGMEGFYKLLKKNMKYPTLARRNSTEGKVFVEFVVSESGNVSNLKVIKGIGFGCDEEAMRVIALSKWNPGKQRGKPVKVRLVQPINFMLGN